VEALVFYERAAKWLPRDTQIRAARDAVRTRLGVRPSVPRPGPLPVWVSTARDIARPDEWARAYDEVRDFERRLTAFGYIVAKFFLHVSPEEQLRRFKERERTPWKRFKITEDDYRNRAKQPEYTKAVNEMFRRTSLPDAPWTLVEGNDKRYARVKVIKTACKALKKALKD